MKPDSLAQFCRSTAQQGAGVRIGEWRIRRGMMPGMIWIEHDSGEGADIPAAKVAAAIDELFAREF